MSDLSRGANRFDLSGGLPPPRQSALPTDLNPPPRTWAISLPARTPVLEGIAHALAAADPSTRKSPCHQIGFSVGELGWLELEQERPRRQFWLMPLMHSEELAVQYAALPLFERFSDPRTADFARRHRDVIACFQRFPHRNAALVRVLSAAERAFLQTPGSRF